MKILMRTLMPTLLICLLAPATVVFAQDNPPKSAVAQSDAKKAFDKLKSLAGSWQGTIMGISINFTIRGTSSGTAILHEGNTSGGGPPNHEITMFYLDGDRLLATHYCDAGNRSRLEGKISPDEKAIEFSFLDVAGSTRGGYLKDMVITMVDADHHIVGFTFVMPDGKPIPLRGEFQRSLSQDNPPKAAAPAIQDNPFTTHNNFVWRSFQNILLRSAEKMPEENYSFRPTEAVRSYGQILGHVVDAQYSFCSTVLGEKNPLPNVEKSKASKADLITAIKDGFAYCDRAYNGMTDAAGATTVKYMGMNSSKLALLNGNILHMIEHYGNLVTYMRMKNIVPPTSEPGVLPGSPKK